MFFFFVHLFSKTKLEHVHCSETSLSGDCVYSKALTHLLTRTDVHFTTVDRTTEQTWLPRQRIQLHSQMNSSRSPMTVGIKSQRLLLQSPKIPSVCLRALTLSMSQVKHSYVCQIQCGADWRGDETRSSHPALGRQEVKGRACIGLQNK